MVLRTAVAALRWYEVVECVNGNPFLPEVRRKRRELEAANVWPADAKAWRSWWDSVREPQCFALPTLLALLAGSGRELDVTHQVAHGERRAQRMQVEWDRLAEIAIRSMRMQHRLLELCGGSAAIEDVRQRCWSASFGKGLDAMLSLQSVIRDTPVLILGDTGTGKERVASALRLSMPGTWSRADGWKPCTETSVHLAAIPATLVESELFGHVKGAFTGALRDRKGVFAEHDGGVVFLDEIAELQPKTQVALLRVLQEGKVRPLGAANDVDADPRIISATHRDLEEMVRDGEFRRDLLFRLNSAVIPLPRLADRKEDLEVLVEDIVTKLDPKGEANVLERALAFVADHEDYDWPGNVRELHAAVLAIALGLVPTLEKPRRREQPMVVPRKIANATCTMREVERWYCRHVIKKTPTHVAAARVLDLDRSTIRTLLQETSDED